MSNKVLITNDQNVVKIPSGLRILIRRSCNAVLDFEKFDGPAEISVTFVDNNRIHELNNEYRHKDSATDVLSFPLGENGEYDIDEDNGCKLLGDIVISMERAMEQAELYGHSLQREVAYLTVHSMLHLLGYDHEAGGLEAVRMREKEEAVLIQLGLPRTVSYTSDEIGFSALCARLCLRMERHPRRSKRGTELPFSPLCCLLRVCGGLLGRAECRGNGADCALRSGCYGAGANELCRGARRGQARHHPLVDRRGRQGYGGRSSTGDGHRHGHCGRLPVWAAVGRAVGCIYRALDPPGGHFALAADF